MKNILFILLIFTSLYSDKVKSLGNFNNLRDNYLTGKGLIIGLSGTGDKSNFSKKALKNVLNKSGFLLTVKDIQTKNIALVLLTAKIPSFAVKGSTVDLVVSTVGDSTSLSGGTLLLTYLKDLNGNVFATCQGEVSLDDRYKTKGFVKNGCILEREVKFKLNNKRELIFSLRQASFDRVLEIEDEINKKFNYRRIAIAMDNKNIKLNKPEELSTVRFMYTVLNLNIKESERRIIIDIKNEILIGGEDVVLNPVNILTKSFVIKVKRHDFNDNNMGDENISDNVIINLKNGLVKRQNNEPLLGDLIRGLHKMDFDFQEIIDIIELLKKKGSISNEIDYI